MNSIIKNDKELIKKFLFIIIIIVLTITVVSIIELNKNHKKETNNPSNDNTTIEQKPDDTVYYIKTTLIDPKIINSTMELINIDIEMSDVDSTVTLTLDIHNITEHEITAFSGYLVFFNEDKEVLTKKFIEVPTIEALGKQTIIVDITGYYGDSRDFTLEI